MMSQLGSVLNKLVLLKRTLNRGSRRRPLGSGKDSQLLGDFCFYLQVKSKTSLIASILGLGFRSNLAEGDR